MALPFDTTAMTAKDAVAAIAVSPLPIEVLRWLHEREASISKPRKGILDALEEKIGQASVPDPALGLAREPTTAVQPEAGSRCQVQIGGQEQWHDATLMGMLGGVKARLDDGMGTTVEVLDGRWRLI